MPLFRGPVRSTGEGRWTIRLSEAEHEVLGSLLTQLEALLLAEGRGPVDPDSVARRLFPTAYAHDEALEADYQRLVHDDLLAGRLTAIEEVREHLLAESLDEEQLGAVLGVLNDLRLVLGTKLDVSEDMEPVDVVGPDAPAYAAFGYLGWLIEHLVDALSGALPPPERA